MASGWLDGGRGGAGRVAAAESGAVAAVPAPALFSATKDARLPRGLGLASAQPRPEPDQVSVVNSDAGEVIQHELPLDEEPASKATAARAARAVVQP